MSVTPVVSTKRDATSPLEEEGLKKSRIGSADSETDLTEKCTINLTDEHIQKIADVLKTTFGNQLSDMVSNIVTGSLGAIQTNVSILQSENEVLRKTVDDLQKRVDALEKRDDKSSQYSRRNCLRLSGVRETENENIDDVVIGIFTKIGADVNLSEIDNMHRLSRPNSKESAKGNVSYNAEAASVPKSVYRPRDIIIKFTTYRTRQAVLSRRRSLDRGIYLNEELTKLRSEVFFHARRLVKNGLAQGTWTTNGIILVKDNNDRIHKCESLDDLTKFKRGA